MHRHVCDTALTTLPPRHFQGPVRSTQPTIVLAPTRSVSTPSSQADQVSEHEKLRRDALHWAPNEVTQQWVDFATKEELLAYICDSKEARAALTRAHRPLAAVIDDPMADDGAVAWAVICDLSRQIDNLPQLVKTLVDDGALILPARCNMSGAKRTAEICFVTRADRDSYLTRYAQAGQPLGEMTGENDQDNPVVADFLRIWANMDLADTFTESEIRLKMPDVKITRITFHVHYDDRKVVDNRYAFIYLASAADVAHVRSNHLQLAFEDGRIVRLYPPTTFPPSTTIIPGGSQLGGTRHCGEQASLLAVQPHCGRPPQQPARPLAEGGARNKRETRLCNSPGHRH